MDALALKTSLLCHGINSDNGFIRDGRKGGAGPAGSCIEVEGMLVNVPTYEPTVKNSPFKIRFDDGFKLINGGESHPIKLMPRPGFYDKTSSDGTPMKKIALLHGRDCLATTLYQRCVLMDMGKGCGFCAIETTLKNGSTILRKTPSQLIEVASEAVKEGATHLAITTGTPDLKDHGTWIMAEAVRSLKEHLDLPIHVQLTPLSRENLELLFDSGADTIGIHVETFDQNVLRKICPGKAGFNYIDALRNAVSLFGENQVSSFVLGGLGEELAKMKSGFEEMASLGVIPYLVPFRPLPGALLERRPPPEPGYMRDLYIDLADALTRYGLDLKKNVAGCVRCGACSAIDVALERRC